MVAIRMHLVRAAVGRTRLIRMVTVRTRLRTRHVHMDAGWLIRVVVVQTRHVLAHRLSRRWSCGQTLFRGSDRADETRVGLSEDGRAAELPYLQIPREESHICKYAVQQYHLGQKLQMVRGELMLPLS